MQTEPEAGTVVQKGSAVRIHITGEWYTGPKLPEHREAW